MSNFSRIISIKLVSGFNSSWRFVKWGRKFEFRPLKMSRIQFQPKTFFFYFNLKFLAFSNESHFAAEGSSRKFSRTLSKPLIGNNGRIYACSEKDFVAFESNGSIAWIIHLNHTCNADMAPVYGGREKVHHFLEFFALLADFLYVSVLVFNTLSNCRPYVDR